jgi:hypothetical protein
MDLDQMMLYNTLLSHFDGVKGDWVFIIWQAQLSRRNAGKSRLKVRGITIHQI